MKVRDLIEQEFDVDVYDDVCEELGIAFCGPLVLTDLGKEKFADVLNYGVSLYDGVAIVNCSAAGDGWENRLRKAKEFFEAAAGYCAADDYIQWFEEEFEKWIPDG